ncbi:MAG TPA: hypothetical protein VGC65_03550 [Bacteroidia bacterium]|jgi:hypothetical protein
MNQPVASLRSTVIIQIITGFFFWFLSVFFAGLNEYEYSSWTILGMFLPGLVFYILKKPAKTITATVLILNATCLLFPGIEFIDSISVIGSLYPMGYIYLLVFSVGCYFFLRTSIQLFRANLNS